MIRIKPYTAQSICSCGGEFSSPELVWQGMHVCEKAVCRSCSRTRLLSLPVNQAGIEQYCYYPETGTVTGILGTEVKKNWYSSRLVSISEPLKDEVRIDIEVRRKYDEVLILNTLDYIYGHSLLFLLNLQRIIKARKEVGVIVIIQPMLRWLVPADGLAEVWTVNLGFRDLYYFHQDLSDKINLELDRFKKVWLSKGHIIPANENIKIEQFTGIRTYDFFRKPSRPRITFIWREDPDRLWIRNIYILKGFKKAGFKKILLPFHLFRVNRFLGLVKKKLGEEYRYTVAGLGQYGRLSSFIEDRRVKGFDTEKERMLCTIYSESELVIGVHGSAMILPSLHAGMAISLMPSKRWGNFGEDILFTENDVRLASFQRRIVPLNLSISDLRDIAADMILGRDYFIRKFIHSEEL